MSVRIKDFRIAVADEQIEDLRRRLQHTRWPDAISGMDWEDGTDLPYLRHLSRYWETTFDWRAQESRLNRLPQFTAEIDGLDVHFVHQRGKGPNPFPLVMTHGVWGSGLAMEQLIARLTDPAAHGGDAEDAFDVVAPSIPGHGFSQRPEHPGIGPAQTAEMWAKLMTGLGYDKFGAQAGDWGSAVSIWLARQHPDLVAGLHLFFLPGRFRPSMEGQPPITAEEQKFLDNLTAWFEIEGGYHTLQSTKPQTPAYALNDSPAGLASWMVEKFRGWSDCGGDVESVFPIDQLLTDISIYWFTQTIGSVMRFYREDRLQPTQMKPGERISPPLGFAVMPKEIDVTPPRSWVERVFNVQRWTQMSRGGHFAAQEIPGELAEDIIAFFRPLR